MLCVFYYLDVLIVYVSMANKLRMYKKYFAY